MAVSCPEVFRGGGEVKRLFLLVAVACSRASFAEGFYFHNEDSIGYSAAFAPGASATGVSLNESLSLGYSFPSGFALAGEGQIGALPLGLLCLPYGCSNYGSLQFGLGLRAAYHFEPSGIFVAGTASLTFTGTSVTSGESVGLILKGTSGKEWQVSRHAGLGFLRVPRPGTRGGRGWLRLVAGSLRERSVKLRVPRAPSRSSMLRPYSSEWPRPTWARRRARAGASRAGSGSRRSELPPCSLG